MHAIQLIPESVRPTTPYWETFKLMFSDLDTTFRYVQPTKGHLGVYSLRYYELLLRTSTEFESICKDKLMELELGKGNPEKFNMKDYRKVGKSLDLLEYVIIYNFDPIYVTQPLANWKTSHQLPWYQHYNSVKHNRNSQFEKANMQNVLDAIGTLFIIITKCKMCPDTSYFGNTVPGVSVIPCHFLYVQK